MQLMKPAPRFGALRNDMEKFFDRFFRHPVFPETLPAATVDTMWEPRLDLSEVEDAYIVRLEIPGVHKENLDVALDGELLTLSGTRTFRREEKQEEYLWEELEEGRFVRTIRLPAPVMGDRVEATYNDGMLMVRLPKAAPSAKNRITIK